MGEALIGQGHLASKQVEVEACEDAHQGWDGNEAVGNTGLERGDSRSAGYALTVDQNTCSHLSIFSGKNT